MPYSNKELHTLLEDAYQEFAKPDFIPLDPIQIPHRFSHPEDIAISGFLSATIAWGQRPTIIRNANRMIELMDHAPYDFISNHRPMDRKRFVGFVHRTFNEIDVMYFLESLQHIYKKYGSLESAFQTKGSPTVKDRISAFHGRFFELEHLPRTRKHISNPLKGSSAKRLNMFLRWMVRPSTEGVDFGLWNTIAPSELIMPLDVHTGTVGRKLGLLDRRQDDWKAAQSLTESLKMFDEQDPVRFDFALFGLGVSNRLL